MAVLHAQGDAWRIVIGEGNGSLRLIAAESLRAGDLGAVRELLDRHGAAMLLRLMPASDAIVRVPELPADADLQDASAMFDVLTLLAETELPAVLPAHRRGAGVLSAPGTSLRVPIIIGWPARAGGAGESIDSERERWTSELVPLMVLAALGKRESATAGVAAYACAEAGSIGMVGLNGSRTALRGIPEPGRDAQAFAGLARGAFAELCARVGADPEVQHWPGAAHRLVVSGTCGAALARQLTGAQDSADWCERYGLAAAGVVAALRDAPETGSLLSLRDAEPRIRRGRIDRALAALATTRGAISAMGIAIAAALLVTLGSAWARAVLLEGRARSLERALDANASGALSIEDQLAVYRELDRARWPMVKLLGDLVAAMPADSPGSLMLADAIELQAGETFVVRGTADSLDLVNRFVAALNGSGVFDNADIRRYEAVGAGVRVEFEVEGAIARPFGIARDVPDFSGAHTVAHKIYGLSVDEEGASVTGQSGTASGDSSPSDAAASKDRQSAPTFEGSEKRGAGRSQEDIPAALTDEEIAAMTHQQAMAEYSKRRSLSRTRTDLTAEVKQRLLDEAEKCRARAQEAKKETPSS